MGQRKYALAAPARKSQLFSISIVKERHFGSSGSNMATFQDKRSKGSALWQLRLESCNLSVQVSCRKTLLAAPARKSQLFSTSAVQEVHFGTGWKVATLQYKCSRVSRVSLHKGGPYTKPLLVGLSLFFCHPFRFACFWHVLLHMLVFMSSPLHIGLSKVLLGAHI